MLEKSVSDVIKFKYSDINYEKFMQHMSVEQRDLLDTHSRHVFTRFAPSIIKCITGINKCGEIIMCIDNSNAIAACPLCGEIEYLNHLLLCENNRNKRKEWVKSLVMKLKGIEQHKNENEEDRGVVKEIENYMIKFFY